MYLVLMLVERHREAPAVGIFGGALQPEVDPQTLPPGHVLAIYDSDDVDEHGFPETFKRVDRLETKAPPPVAPIVTSLEPRRKTVKKRKAKNSTPTEDE